MKYLRVYTFKVNEWLNNIKKKMSPILQFYLRMFAQRNKMKTIQAIKQNTSDRTINYKCDIDIDALLYN